MPLKLICSLCLIAALSGCAGGGERPRSAAASVAGQTIQVTTAAGKVTTMHFAEDGSVRAAFDGRQVEGRWSAEQRKLCFTWAGDFRECWPYPAPLRRGEARAITSDRGNRVTVELR